jgi:cell division septation protein DedD
MVAGLDGGQWYVQVGAFRCPVGAEAEIRRASARHPYPMVVQNVGTEAEPVFRLLFGPLNQGESAAALLRVRSMGNDAAFARQGERIRTSPYSP